jgi:hypothetical protein
VPSNAAFEAQDEVRASQNKGAICLMEMVIEEDEICKPIRCTCWVFWGL